jgi:hypothetical protein
MFNWHAADGSFSEAGSSSVVKSFWVYWAVTVPLTVVVITIWRLWWSRERRQFEHEIDTAIDDTDNPTWRSDDRRATSAATAEASAVEPPGRHILGGAWFRGGGTRSRVMNKEVVLPE